MKILPGFEYTPFLHGQVACNLYHPGFAWVGCDAGNVELTGIEFDEEQDIKRDKAA
jgi:hypothetical protein